MDTYELIWVRMSWLPEEHFQKELAKPFNAEFAEALRKVDR